LTIFVSKKEATKKPQTSSPRNVYSHWIAIRNKKKKASRGKKNTQNLHVGEGRIEEAQRTAGTVEMSSEKVKGRKNNDTPKRKKKKEVTDDHGLRQKKEKGGRFSETTASIPKAHTCPSSEEEFLPYEGFFAFFWKEKKGNWT